MALMRNIFGKIWWACWVFFFSLLLAIHPKSMHPLVHLVVKSLHCILLLLIFIIYIQRICCAAALLSIYSNHLLYVELGIQTLHAEFCVHDIMTQIHRSVSQPLACFTFLQAWSLSDLYEFLYVGIKNLKKHWRQENVPCISSTLNSSNSVSLCRNLS